MKPLPAIWPITANFVLLTVLLGFFLCVVTISAGGRMQCVAFFEKLFFDFFDFFPETQTLYCWTKHICVVLFPTLF